MYRLLIFAVAGSLFLSFPSHGQDDAPMVEPNEKGIFELDANNAVLKGMNRRDLYKGVSTGLFSEPQSEIIWYLNVPSYNKYTLELCWTVKYAGGTLVIDVNDKTFMKWKAIGTWDHRFVTTRLKKISLAEGKGKLAFSMPAQKSWESRLEFRSVRLIPSNLDDEIARLKKQSCLGMSLDDMELRFGKGMAEEKCFDLNKDDGSRDEAKRFDDNAAQNCEAVMWRFGDTNYIKAAFLDGKCVALSLPVDGRSFPKVAAYASELMGGARVPTKDYSTKKDTYTAGFTIKDRKYLFQYWHNDMNFQLKDLTAAEEYNAK